MAIAASKNPPYPRHDLELRADMGRNTMRRQLERAVTAQREYEDKNAEKLQQARDQREAERRRREEEKQKEAERLLEQKRRIAQERQEMLEKTREITAKREEEERIKHAADYTTDSETGEQVKKRAKKAARKRKSPDFDSDGIEVVKA